jgi:hypothetical protein
MLIVPIFVVPLFSQFRLATAATAAAAAIVGGHCQRHLACTLLLAISAASVLCSYLFDRASLPARSRHTLISAHQPTRFLSAGSNF